MKYKVHRLDINMYKDQQMLGRFLNSLKGEVISIIPNVAKTTFAQIYGFTRKIDFLLIVEKLTIPFSVVLLCSVLHFLSCKQNGQPVVKQDLGEKTTAFYGIEMNDQLCGYKEFYCTRVFTDQGEMCRITEKSHLRMNLMGKRMITNIQTEAFFDTSLLRMFYSSYTIDQGKMHLKSQIAISKDTAFITANNTRNKEVALPPDIYFENGMYKPELIHANDHDTSLPLKLKFFNEVKAIIDTKTYRWKSRDTLRLADQTFYTICLQETNHSTGERSEIWLEEYSGLLVQAIFHTSGIKLFLAPRDITGQLVTATVDDILFYKVHEVIPDFKTLSYLKVHMVINSSGDSLAAEALNSPGQTFTGSVENNIIDGIFEIRQPKYKGSDAPGYPYDYDLDSSLNVYFELQRFVCL